MLSLLGKNQRRRGRLSRRDVLQVGVFAAGGLTLTELMRRRSQAAAGAPNGKSVILIWLRGGASHIDSYDMKPAAGDFPGDELGCRQPRHRVLRFRRRS